MDRNSGVDFTEDWLDASLSARRAWIEIEVENGFAGVLFVALRKESVDRNSRCARLVAGRPNVALRKESVDRN